MSAGAAVSAGSAAVGSVPTEDRELPKAVVMRLIKDAIPDGVNVGKDARAAFSVSARIFVSYLTATANDIAEKAGHKTLTAADIIQALHEIEFPQFEEPVQEILEAYKEIQRVKRSRKLAEKEAGKEGEKADESEPAESPGADNGAAAGGAAAAAAAADMQEDA